MIFEITRNLNIGLTTPWISTNIWILVLVDILKPGGYIHWKYFLSAKKYNTTCIIQKQTLKVLYKKGVLKNWAQFSSKHLRWSLYFRNVAGLIQVFSCEFCDIFKNTCFTDHLWQSTFDYWTKVILRKYHWKDVILDHFLRSYGVLRL